MKSNHERFIEHLKESRAAVWYVAYWLNVVKEFPVAIPATKIAKAHSEWMINKDDGDLHIVRKESSEWARIEVKEMGFNFTGPQDYKYPRILVCAQHMWDGARLKPYCFIHLSHDWNHAALIFGNTFDNWGTKLVTDKRYKPPIDQDCYDIALHHVEWRKIEFPD